jgi:hypothetical protein
MSIEREENDGIKESEIITSEDEQKEARRLLMAIDLLANRLNDWEKKFVINLVEHPDYELTPKRIETINMIADKHNIY